MSDEWSELASYPDQASALAVVGLLHQESIPARVDIDEPVPGLLRHCSVWVPRAALARARAVCAQAPLSEEEWLEYERERRSGDVSPGEDP